MKRFPNSESCERAAAYHRLHRGTALVVMRDGQFLWETYANGGAADRPQAIASGTKSYSGVIAAQAAEDGLLDLDSPVAETLFEWRSDARKSLITVRHLLQLVSGLAPTRPGHSPTYEASLLAPCDGEPGTRFRYSSTPFQVFGELARRRLLHLCEDPALYLAARVLDPLQAPVSRWRTGRDGMPDLSAGAVVTARNWATFGEWVRVRILPDSPNSSAFIAGCFAGSNANPAYGLGWWLNAPLPQGHSLTPQLRALGLEDLHADPAVPRDLVYAAGAGKQRLYICPGGGWVSARQADGVLEALAGGERSPFSDREFLRLLLADP